MYQEPGKKREFSAELIPMPPRDGCPEMRWSSLYELSVKHRDGSLEAAVNNNRMRSFGVSYGVLLLLSASIGFLLIKRK
jgi:hypothetical protein